ncbi:MAG: class I SAM-dependent methyltransferase family protein [Candidatus Aenigmarchaeota archaeon]|nr:class I SAM-dependent methyltransferase family protein [Candidatus Aenigmarchaeota archaeon]MDW8149802.1 class I SAM-dependent methyltransferase family protein [Candidatus Aenigmarchaeota archaeon]
MSIEIIGSREKAIAIVSSEKEINIEEIFKNNKNVKSILKKIGKREGEFRLEKLEIIAGSYDTEVIHKEFNLKLKLDPTKVYFSSREATERRRIVNLVSDNEKILVMFSGIAPIAIHLAKSKNVKVYCIELNKIAHEYAKENIKINRVEDKVFLFNGDVREVCRNELKYEKFDRIIMPIINSLDFLDLAIEKINKNGFIHVYFVSKENDFSELKERLKSFKFLEITNIQKVLAYAPRAFKYRADLKIFYGD